MEYIIFLYNGFVASSMYEKEGLFMKEMNNRDTMKAIMITLHNVVLCNFAHKSHLLQYEYNIYVGIIQGKSKCFDILNKKLLHFNQQIV